MSERHQGFITLRNEIQRFLAILKSHLLPREDTIVRIPPTQIAQILVFLFGLSLFIIPYFLMKHLLDKFRIGLFENL